MPTAVGIFTRPLLEAPATTSPKTTTANDHLRAAVAATAFHELIATLTDGLSDENLAVTCRTMKAMQANVNARINA